MSETDISKEMVTFRETIRHIWNTLFLPTSFSQGLRLEHARSLVEAGLFEGILLIPNNRDELAKKYRKCILEDIIFRPIEILDEFSLIYGEDGDNDNIRWSKSVLIKNDFNISFYFYDLFDWDQYGPSDLTYVRGRIRNMESSSANVFKNDGYVLLKFSECRFYLVSP